MGGGEASEEEDDIMKEMMEEIRYSAGVLQSLVRVSIVALRTGLQE